MRIRDLFDFKGFSCFFTRIFIRILYRIIEGITTRVRHLFDF